MMSDTFADVLNQSALKNDCNAVVSIFLSKALYGYRETSELVVTPNERMAYDNEPLSQAEIRARYEYNNDDEMEE